MSSFTAQNFVVAAEDNFRYHNFEEAVRLANIAKKLDPQFDGVDRLVAAYTVHLAATQKKPNGDIDWYAVLGIVDALADTETIKKSYKKLALMVHPDKNCSSAAEGAFKLVSEAWNALSHPSMRKAYDLRWGSRPTPTRNESPHPGSCCSCGRSSSANSFGGRACPRCSVWCNYENETRSSITCNSCNRRYAFRSSPSADSVPPRPSGSAGADQGSGGASMGSSVPPRPTGSTGADQGSRAASMGSSVPPRPSGSAGADQGSRGASMGSSSDTQMICPHCNTPVVDNHSGEWLLLFVTCPKCQFRYRPGSRPHCSNEGKSERIRNIRIKRTV